MGLRANLLSLGKHASSYHCNSSCLTLNPVPLNVLLALRFRPALPGGRLTDCPSPYGDQDLEDELRQTKMYRRQGLRYRSAGRVLA